MSDRLPGLRRLRAGRGFRYIDERGRPVRAAAVLSRIKSLAIPPAWSQVWICSNANGHLQASGRDARGRKQYRYHPRWRLMRDETKYHRLIAFALSLPRIRRRTRRDLARAGLPREKVLAAVVRLLEWTLIRVGNEEYARANGSFGLTTMRNHHVDVRGSDLHFDFRGKSGIRHIVDVHNRSLARLVARCQDLPGEELFQYIDSAGERHPINSEDVNAYLRDVSGQDFTAKDFRTWAGTVLTARALRECQAGISAKRQVVAAVEIVARQLGNTRAVCRKCYVHPAIVDAHLDGSLGHALGRPAKPEILQWLSAEEAAVLALLRQRLRQEEKQPKSRGKAG